MGAVRIRLPRGAWWFDPDSRLGPRGGFGDVFEGGRSADDRSLAIKRLLLSAGEAGHRELDIAEVLVQRDLEWVVPILDAGQDAESERYFVVMERAEGNLRGPLVQETPPLPVSVEIVRSIALSLLEVPDIVHRDLKPENVLFHAGRWKLADFGIARFVEAATSTATVRDCLTPAYAAPEQWRSERAVPATDVYALGCIAYELMAGTPPFTGSVEEIRDGHLHRSAARPPKIQDPTWTLVSMILRKPVEARPSLERVLEVLDRIGLVGDVQYEGLQAAAAQVAQAQVETEAKQRRQRTAREERDRLGRAGAGVLDDLMERLLRRVFDAAPNASRLTGGSGVQLGQARLYWKRGQPFVESGSFPQSGWDVVAVATMHVRQPSDRYPGRGASLLYARLPRANDYRWYQVPFMVTPLARSRQSFEEYPFAITDLGEMDLALSNVIHIYQKAAPVTPIDDEDFDSFAAQWINRLASAASNKLSYPSRLPES